MEPKFEEYPEIVRLSGEVVITEKIHGSNAQIFIEEVQTDSGPSMQVRAGSRTRWLVPGDDNFGFAHWVNENREALIKSLGVGRHFAEWYGAGINSGYGLKEKRLALFNTHRWTEPKKQGLLPDRVDVVPILYKGPWKDGVVSEVMEKLKTEGSQLQKGFMKPEGAVIYFCRNGASFKHVFEAEETGWAGKPKDKSGHVAKPGVDFELVRPWLQPIRLEKLLSRDERYQREWPKSIADLCRDYVADLEKETDLATQEELGRAVRKNVFSWAKQVMGEKGYSA